MHTLIRLLVAVLAALSLPASADESAVRLASEALIRDWNRHDLKAWGAHLAADVWYSETWDTYERMKGREKVLGWFGPTVQESDLHWDIVRMSTRPDGVVSVVLVERKSILPKTDGKYKAVYTSDPSLARWRRDADGRWRLVFFTSNKGWALAEIKKDDEARNAAAAPAPAPAPALAPSAAARPRRAATGSEPDEYTAFWGRMAQSCTYCHGRPPALPSSDSASRIVAVGAATASGAALRAAMQRKELGGMMDRILAEPALTDAGLEAIRRYLVDVRDGALPAEAVFDKPGAGRVLELRNERSSRDPPVALALLRVSGPFAIDARGSTCRSGARLAGQSTCRLSLRAAAGAAAGAIGKLEWRLAPSEGLEPQPGAVALRLGS
ncbi:MAG: nuclear transport factor 2 family protein [Caldimonas sp.]